MSTQLPLLIGLRDSATFANYYAGRNQQAVEALHALATLQGEQCIFLWGAPGTGKTHLLHAVCNTASQAGVRAALLPLSGSEPIAPALLDGMETMQVVCIDDVQGIAGDTAWETALFNLYNRARESGTRLVYTADTRPNQQRLGLADLKSRLAACLIFQLVDQDDPGKLVALQLRARSRGFELPSEVASYMLRRCPRDMPGLFATLDRLDRASLAAQRKLTIPFVRRLLVG